MYMPMIGSAIQILSQICQAHHLLHGNTTDIDFEDDNSLLSESAGADKN
jgi:hypothetical protein